MGRAGIKVIKKCSKDVQPNVAGNTKPGATEKKKSFSKNAVNTIENNIKGWIEELNVRKSDEMLQAHNLLVGI